MRIPKNKIERLRGMIEGEPRNIVIIIHYNPDGDAIGSSLALAAMLESFGHRVTCTAPNNYPYFLEWMPGIDKIKVFKKENHTVTESISEADIIFCVDFNQVSRLENLSDAIDSNRRASFVLIDHHLNPPHGFELEFSYPEICSTTFIVYNIIKSITGIDSITKDMAEAIYVGIMTDTGNFSYSYLTSDLFRAVAVLVDKGLDIPEINRKIYSSFTADRLRLLGYALNKMEIFSGNKWSAAYITLSEKELRKFRFQQGDSEGFVNFPLSVKDLLISAVFIETKQFIRVSLRSRGSIDVSLFASLYFDGGGHKNAAGGKSTLNMKETVEYYKKSVEDFFANHYRV